jgi:hypothetical protein
MTDAQFNLLRRMAEQGLQANMDIGLGANVLAALLADLTAAREALADMVNQYMGYRDEGYVSHEFMSAQENAIEYLETIGWLRSAPMECYYWTAASGREKVQP